MSDARQSAPGARVCPVCGAQGTTATASTRCGTCGIDYAALGLRASPAPSPAMPASPSALPTSVPVASATPRFLALTSALHTQPSKAAAILAGVALIGAAIWVSRGADQPARRPGLPTTAAASLRPTFFVVVTGDVVRVREYPAVTAPIVARVGKGLRLGAVASQDGWHRVVVSRAQGTSVLGWVKGEFTRLWSPGESDGAARSAAPARAPARAPVAPPPPDPPRADVSPDEPTPNPADPEEAHPAAEIGYIGTDPVETSGADGEPGPPAHQPLLPRILGRWNGSVSDPWGEVLTIHVRFMADPRAGALGHVDYPAVGCAGTLALEEVTADGEFVFRETIDSGPCTSGSLLGVMLRDDMTAVFGRRRENHRDGEVTRREPTTGARPAPDGADGAAPHAGPEDAVAAPPRSGRTPTPTPSPTPRPFPAPRRW